MFYKTYFTNPLIATAYLCYYNSCGFMCCFKPLKLYAILRISRMEETMVKAIVGANWGDEGKGKITDMLAEESDIVVRFQGGSNAGHTIINDYGKFALHLLPSGVFYNHITSVIGNGVALNIPYLIKEIKSITDRNVPMPKILVSDALSY